MKITTILSLGLASIIAATRAFAVLSFGPGGDGVTVGSSSLIRQLDYSDSWTEGINGRIANQSFPVGATQGAAALQVESIHASPPVAGPLPHGAWTDTSWSFAKDTSFFGAYPGGTGAGSASGITQTGGGGVDWGIEYGMSKDYFVQFDAVQTNDRIDITTSSARNSIFNAVGLSLFYRTGGVSLFNSGIGDIPTGIATGVGVSTWHNYAARFNLEDQTISVYVDEVFKGIIDLNTFSGGAFLPLALNPALNSAVSVGYGGEGGIGFGGTWTDNFQVGRATVPEPSTLALIGLGLSGLFWARRNRR